METLVEHRETRCWETASRHKAMETNPIPLYCDAVNAFSEQKGESADGIYGWLSSRRTDTLTAAGFYDDSYTDDTEDVEPELNLVDFDDDEDEDD